MTARYLCVATGCCGLGRVRTVGAAAGWRDCGGVGGTAHVGLEVSETHTHTGRSYSVGGGVSDRQGAGSG